jgi:hypothetical protein
MARGQWPEEGGLPTVATIRASGTHFTTLYMSSPPGFRQPVKVRATTKTGVAATKQPA